MTTRRLHHRLDRGVLIAVVVGLSMLSITTAAEAGFLRWVGRIVLDIADPGWRARQPDAPKPTPTPAPPSSLPPPQPTDIDLLGPGTPRLRMPSPYHPDDE